MHRRRSPTHEGIKYLPKGRLDMPADFRERLALAKSRKWAIPHWARQSFKTHLHHRFGGAPCLFDVVCQMGGIIREPNGDINITTRRSARISWIRAGPPSLARGARQGGIRGAAEGGGGGGGGAGRGPCFHPWSQSG